MRACLTLVLCSTCMLAQPQQPPGVTLTEPDSNTLTQTSLLLELTRKVTSKTAKPGDDVHFIIVEDVVEDGLVVIAKNTTVDGKVERVDKRGGWAKDAGLIVSIGPVKTVTGEELPIAGTIGNKGGDPNKPTKDEILAGALSPYVIMMPYLLLGPFEKGHHYVFPAGTRSLKGVTLPSQLDRARLLAAQPKPEKPGYATVYFVPPDVVTDEVGTYYGDVWCGAVKVAGGILISSFFSKVLLRPGHYSCRVAKFSPLEFDVVDGGTYYLLVTTEPGLFHIKSGSLSLATAAGAVYSWNVWMQKHPSGGKAKDLTKTDPALFSKWPPSLPAKQP